ncbi:IclR family transcriptional regulator [Phyllobacterium chamaecytisi]|uniref:IclR family transcriptional regulator n=1 Tax=Phyllobacterium chamaecytisi TaxID=2876082 RepID=UPI001CCBEAD4|nr:IclR family transcriptional regulator [Phyllobacterium sp. KW56]MBZ9605565.1 IclR family transcriptional regulator [Phyllobacterium sp. KW56]
MENREQSLSVQKALVILELIGGADEPVTVTEIVKTTGINKTTVLRILSTFGEERYIERDKASGGYRLGVNLIAVAQRALRQNPLIIRAKPILDEIVALTGDSGLLMTLERGMSLCVERRASTTPIKVVGTDLGTRSPVHAGGGPFALLAFSSDEFVDEYLSKPLQKATAKTIVEPAAVRERIREARERGYTIGSEDLFEYIVAVGIPIRNNRGQMLGSLSIGGLVHRFPHERCIELGRKLIEISARHLR